jgi:hypothetical protein
MDNPTPWVPLKNELLMQIESGILEPGDEVAIAWESRDFGVGRGSNRPRRILTVREVTSLAEIFGVTPEWLMTSTCSHCHGLPPAGFACLSCGAKG